MKTIEIKDFKYSKLSIGLLKKLYKLNLIEHYFYEPNLIIRTNKPKQIIPYLKNLEYNIYNYPNIKKGYDENKVFYHYEKEFKIMYKLQSKLAITAKLKDKDFIGNRFLHCFLNMRGFEYYDECKYYLWQAQGYMKHQYRKDGKISTLILHKIIKFIYNIT